MKRELATEMMDSPAADRADLAASLEDLRRVGRWLGGRRTAVREVLRLARMTSARPVTVLDIGTGGADVPIALLDAADRQGIEMRIIATDLHPGTLDLARKAVAGETRISIRSADATALPFAAGEVDIAMCNTTLHHFSDADALRVLMEMDRVTEMGLVVTDLERTPAALAGVRLLAGTAWRNHPITRHDGPASVRAAFTLTELQSLGRRANLPDLHVRRTPVFRLGLTSSRSVRA